MAGRQRGAIERDILAAYATWPLQRRRDLRKQLDGAEVVLRMNERQHSEVVSAVEPYALVDSVINSGAGNGEETCVTEERA